MRFLSIFLFALFFFNGNAQNKITLTNNNEPVLLNTKPKLVVGIVVDQMRYDYLTRFYNKYGDGGFKLSQR